MGQLGNYIHYRARNYRDSGINHKGQPKGVTAAQALNEQHQHIRKRVGYLSISGQDLIELNSKLNLMYMDVKNPNSNLAKRLMEQLVNDFGKKLGTVDLNTLAVVSNATLKQKKSITKSKLDISRNKHAIMKSTLDNRLTQIKELKRQVTNVKTKKQLNSIIERSTAIINQLKQVNTEERALIKRNGIAFSVKENKEALTNLEKLFNQSVQLLTPSIAAQQQGDLFEYMLALLPAYLQDEAETLANQEVAAQLFKNKVGNTRTDKVQIAMDFNKGFLDPSVFSLESYSQVEPGVFVHKGGQDKIDVEFTWNDTPYKISAKNTKNTSNIHVVSSQSLLYLMQGERTNFMNHFLNLTTKHPDSSYLPAQSTINKYKQMMQTTILSKVISGQTSGKTKIAEILVVNDAKSGKYQVFAIKDILNKLVENAYKQSIGNAEMVSIEGTGEAKISATAKITGKYNFRNDWELNGASTRISKVMMDVHRQKISAAINIKKI